MPNGEWLKIIEVYAPHDSTPKVAAQVAYTCQLFYWSK